MQGADVRARADALTKRFGSDATLASVRPVAAAAVPEPSRSLLAHDRHMTDAQERFHGGLVELRVLAVTGDGRDYAREILLERADGAVVQYGIARIDLDALGPAVATRVIAADVPLGRILTEAGIFCAVSDVALVEVVPGPRLATFAGSDQVYGRVACIRVRDRPVIDLLEIVMT